MITMYAVTEVFHYGNANINLYSYAFTPSHSANTTVTGSPNLISSDDAKAIVAEAALPGPPKPIDPEGIINACCIVTVLGRH